MNRLLPVLLISLLAFTSMAAGTVTLTGTCSAVLNRDSSINFSITNSGTDAASGMLIQSFMAFSNNLTGTYPANQIGPGQSVGFAINSSIGNRTGSFVYYFLATYQQGSQIFTVVFPCTVDSRGATASLAGISNVSVQDINQSTAKVSGSIYSFSQATIAGNVTLIVPPEFRSSGQKALPFSVGPYQYYNFTFYTRVNNQQNSTYSGAVALEYTENGISHSAHSALSIISIKPYSQKAGIISSYYAIIAAVLAIVVILLLIARQRLAKKRVRKSSS